MKRRRQLPHPAIPGYISIRSGAGLGDSLYLQSAVRHCLARGEKMEACTWFPDVFLPLKERYNGGLISRPDDQLRVSTFRRAPIERVAHYTGRKDRPDTDQFRDCCERAGLGFDVELKIDWKVRNDKLVEALRRSDKPVICVQLPRLPMARTDGFGDELLPDCRVMQRAIDLFKGRAFIVQIGKGQPLYRFNGINIDLSNRTTVSNLLDVASVADGFLGYCSFIAPLAESFGKPLLLVWSRRGANSTQRFIKQITPRKIFYLESSRAVMDDCSEEELQAAVEDLYSRTWKPEEVAA